MNSLSPAGLRASAVFLVLACGVARAETIVDDFARPDGPADGWSAFRGPWSIASERLTTTTNGQEHWVWFGEPASPLPQGTSEFSYTYEFLTTPADDVGRHGGAAFMASVPTHRNDTAGPFSGYTVDWIDRTAPPNDHGVRLIRIDDGVHTGIGSGGTELPEPPTDWRIEIDGELILVYGDDALLLEVADGTYRGGHFGLWVYSNNEEIAVDDVQIVTPDSFLTACFTASVVRGEAPLEVDFDATCTQSSAGIREYQWDFGDGNMTTGETVKNTYTFAENYTVTLTVTDLDGMTDSATALIEVVEFAKGFSDEFDRPDGPPADWTVSQGDWSILDEELVTTSVGGENWIWAGDPPLEFGGQLEMSFTYRFLAPGANPVVGRHGGVMIFASVPTNRGGGDQNGYTIDWIDRDNDHGFRLIRVDAGVHTPIGSGARDVPEPPEEWRVVVVGETISVYGDGSLLAQVRDATHRSGLFGFWAWNDQSVAIDNLEISKPDVFLLPCFTVSPAGGHFAGDDLTFDASCTQSSSPVASFTWDFGDGSPTASGQVVEHTFTATGHFDVSLTVENEVGATEVHSETVTVTVITDHFEDPFDQADGEPENWTITAGTWNVLDGALGVEAPAPPEAWIFAGSPPIIFADISGFSLLVTFANDPGDVVGRHGGLMFFAESSAPRWETSGYTIDWIDRTADPNDRGYRVYRWDAGGPVLLDVLDPGAAEPGEEWEIEVDDEAFRLLVDGEEKGEIFDATYRQGQFGLWSYTNNQNIVFDDVLIGEPIHIDGGFRRGDTDASGVVDISDPIFNLTFQFVGGIDKLPCEDAADVDDSGVVDISDPIYNLTFQFVGGIAPPPAPGEKECGPDPTADERNCEAYPPEKC